MAPTRRRLSPANSQHRPLRSWLVTFQSSSSVDSEWSVLLRTSRLIATSSTETLVTAFRPSRYAGLAAKSLRSSSRSCALNVPSLLRMVPPKHRCFPFQVISAPRPHHMGALQENRLAGRSRPVRRCVSAQFGGGGPLPLRRVG